MEIKELLKKFRAQIDNEIVKYIPDNSRTTIYDSMKYVSSTSGKRLRPALCLLTCEILGGDSRKALPVASAIEIIHNATLVHDDIEDGDKIRRNAPTVWMRYGIPQSINTGDGLIFKAYECLLYSKQFLTQEQVIKLAEMFTDCLTKIVEGQSMEFDFKNKKNVGVEEYAEMARKKAGILIGFSLSSGAFIAGKSDDLQSDLMEYGEKIGLAFQIQDDILNLFGKRSEYGKEIGSDIKEGKKTLMIIDCLNKCKGNEKEKLLRILEKGERITKNDIQTVISLIKKYNSREVAIGYAKKVINSANDILNKIVNDDLKSFLHKLSDFMIERRY